MRRSRWFLRGLLAVLVGLIIGIVVLPAHTPGSTARADGTDPVVNYSATYPDGTVADSDSELLSTYAQPLTYEELLTHSQNKMVAEYQEGASGTVPTVDGFKVFGRL
ncbi:hypothetical protein [Levilactobacillus humaensis]|uniref:hypothetical protein n=1 Tax=Levilactobacillus humaensis TaxID=2950375 RepID=UPI0021C3710E|nr:hypothetical protein [Levilactobacillus humaensis]